MGLEQAGIGFYLDLGFSLFYVFSFVCLGFFGYLSLAMARDIGLFVYFIHLLGVSGIRKLWFFIGNWERYGTVDLHKHKHKGNSESGKHFFYWDCFGWELGLRLIRLRWYIAV